MIGNTRPDRSPTKGLEEPWVRNPLPWFNQPCSTPSRQKAQHLNVHQYPSLNPLILWPSYCNLQLQQVTLRSWSVSDVKPKWFASFRSTDSAPILLTSPGLASRFTGAPVTALWTWQLATSVQSTRYNGTLSGMKKRYFLRMNWINQFQPKDSKRSHGS